MGFQHTSDEQLLSQLLNSFVDAGLHGRFVEALDLVDESYFGIGMGEQGIVNSKEDALLVLRDAFRMQEGTTITYDVQNFTINRLDKDAAIVFGKVAVTSTDVDGHTMCSGIMQTIGARRSNGCWRIAFTHASPVSLTAESVKAYPVRFLDGALSALWEEQLPRRDTLTGVLNREGLELRAAKLQQEYNPDYTTVLFMLDLDDFKQINDRLGHQVGDVVLQKVAQAICSTFQDSDTVGRIGGDEFMVLFSGNFSVKYLETKANELLGAMRLRITEDQQIPISISIGIAYGRSRATFEKLYYIADTALYSAKRAGKAQYYLINFDTNIHRRSESGGANLLSLQSLLKREDGEEAYLGKSPYETLVQNIPGGIIMFELSGNGALTFTLCNEWLSRLVEYSISELSNMQSGSPFALIHPDDLPKVMGIAKIFMDGADSSNIIYRVRHKDGRYIYVNQVAAVTERSHNSIMVLGTLTDVDEIIRHTDFGGKYGL